MTVGQRQLPKGTEVRAAPTGGSLKLKRGATGKTRLLSGYAAVFDSWTSIGPFLEKIARGAFRETLADPKSDPVAVMNHDASLILGRRSAGTLRLREDAHGLAYEVDLDLEDDVGRRVARKVERGELQANSFAFMLDRDGVEWGEDSTGNVTRTIVKVSRLLDIGPVTWPAYGDAAITGLRADELLAEARSAGLVRPVRLSHDEHAKRLEDMLRGLQLQLQSESVHGDNRRILEKHAAQLARSRRRSA